MGAWADAILPLRLLNQDHIPVWLYLAAMLVAVAVVAFLLYKTRPTHEQGSNTDRTWLAWLVTGLLWCLVSGWPIWLAGLEIGVDLASTRFAMPFLPGAVLVAGGLVLALRRFRWLQIGLAALLIGSSIAMQVLIGNSYRMDWQSQKAFYTQLFWRFDGIRPGTMLIVNHSPSSEGEENTLAAELNWFFSPPA